MAAKMPMIAMTTNSSIKVKQAILGATEQGSGRSGSFKGLTFDTLVFGLMSHCFHSS
jgi:hypothetical protein